MDLLKLVLVVAAVAGVLLLMARRLRLTGNGAHARLPGPSDVRGFPSALVAATAAATALSPTGADPLAAGATIAVAVVLLGLPGLDWARKASFGAAAGAGVVVHVLSGFYPVPDCTDGGALGAWFAILLAVIAAVAGAAGWLLGHRQPPSPLAYFGAYTVITFLASPLGVPVFATTQPAAAAGVAIAAAAVFGFAAGGRPGPVIGLASVAIGLTTVAVSAVIVPACTAILNGSQAYTLIAFTAVYTLLKAATDWIRR